MTALPFPTDPATPSLPNPFFQDNNNVRGDQERDFSGQVWANFTAINSRLNAAEALLDQPGDFKLFGGFGARSGYLDCDGTAYATAAYAALWAALHTSKGTCTITIASPGVVSNTGHGLVTGERVYLTTTGALPTGLSASTTFYVIRVDADTFRLALTRTLAQAGTAINTSGSQSGTHTLWYAPFGIQNASNFYVPDFRGLSPVGAGTNADAWAVDALSNGYLGVLGLISRDQMQGHYHQNGYNNTKNYDSGIIGGDFLATGGITNDTNGVQQPTTDGTHGTPRTGAQTNGPTMGVRILIKT